MKFDLLHKITYSVQVVYLHSFIFQGWSNKNWSESSLDGGSANGSLMNAKKHNHMTDKLEMDNLVYLLFTFSMKLWRNIKLLW